MPELNLNDLLARHITRPLTGYVSMLRNKVADINGVLARSAALDQYPGRMQPRCFTRLYGPLSLTTARRDGEIGFEGLAAVAEPAQFVLPRNGNIKVGRFGSFVWMETSVNAYLSWTYNTDPGIAGNQKVFTTFGDIFDPVIASNGGAMVMNNFRWTDPGVGVTDFVPIVSFDLALYDKLRGRYLHDGQKLPINLFSGQGYCNKKTGQDSRFDPDSEIEPRLFINDIRVNNTMATSQWFNASNFKVYVSLTFKGRLEQQEP